MRRTSWNMMQRLACWNWKCALMSAAVRSLVYLVAMMGSRSHGRLAVIAVEIAYVTLTAGAYAGMQQRALSLRSHMFGNLIVVLGVPGLAQFLDWLAHRTISPTVPSRAILAASIFTLVSALFHLHVMRRGVFLTGRAGHTLVEDFRSIPRLVLDFVLVPYALVAGSSSRFARAAQSQGQLAHREC